MRRDDPLYNQFITHIHEEGYSVEEFARLLSIHRKTLYRYLTHKKIPKAIKEKMIELLGKETEHLIFQITHPHKKTSTETVSNGNENYFVPAKATQHASFVVQSLEGTHQNDAAAVNNTLLLPPFSEEDRPDMVPLDRLTWFGQKVTDIRSLVIGATSQSFSYQQIQVQTRVEIERLLMHHFHAHDDNETRISRRMALTTLAALSTTLLKKIQNGQLSSLVVDEFLAQCAQSITACHYLLREDGLFTVAYTLPRYLPTLSLLAEQSTPYQKQAASLAAQGYQLYALVALHYLRFSERERACHQALRYSKISSDENLTAYALLNIAGDVKDPGKQLSWYQESAKLLQNISPILKSKVLIGLGKAYARCGQVQEALRHMKQALEVLPVKPEDDETSLYAETMPSLCMWEGLIYLNLGLFASQHDRPYRARVLYQASWNAFAQIDTPTTMPVPKRLSIETINLQAEAAIALRDFDSFQKAFLAGVQGAKELGSHKRRDEASANWQAAYQIWNKESKMLDLANALIECKLPQTHS